MFAIGVTVIDETPEIDILFQVLTCLAGGAALSSTPYQGLPFKENSKVSRSLDELLATFTQGLPLELNSPVNT